MIVVLVVLTFCALGTLGVGWKVWVDIIFIVSVGGHRLGGETDLENFRLVSNGQSMRSS